MRPGRQNVLPRPSWHGKPVRAPQIGPGAPAFRLPLAKAGSKARLDIVAPLHGRRFCAAPEGAREIKSTPTQRSTTPTRAKTARFGDPGTRWAILFRAYGARVLRIKSSVAVAIGPWIGRISSPEG